MFGRDFWSIEKERDSLRHRQRHHGTALQFMVHSAGFCQLIWTAVHLVAHSTRFGLPALCLLEFGEPLLALRLFDPLQLCDLEVSLHSVLLFAVRQGIAGLLPLVIR